MVNCSTGTIAFLPIAVKNVFDKNYFPRLSLPLQCKTLLTADTLLFCVLLSIFPLVSIAFVCRGVTRLLFFVSRLLSSICFVFYHTMKRLYSIFIHYSIFFFKYIYIRGETEQSLCSNIRIILNTLSFCTLKMVYKIHKSLKICQFFATFMQHKNNIILFKIM